MKKFYSAFAIVIVLNVLLLFAGRKPEVMAPAGRAPLRVGLVFDVGGRGDKSFNDAAYAGMMRAAAELGVAAEYIEPGEGSDREAALRILAAQGFDLVFGIGFIFTDDVINMGREYPHTRFACIDYAGDTPPANVLGIRFREEEGSFLVGALAGLVSKTNRVGFVGGMDIPLIHKFEAGFRAGATAVRPGITVVSNYAGVTGAAFKDPAKGKELALSQYGQGADIIFHASGSTGLGVFEAARSMNKLAIGVDADQYGEAPGFILTSMLKQVDVAVFDTIKACVDGTFASGIRTFGLRENGVGFVYDEHNRGLISEQIYQQVMHLRQQVIDGTITVPAA